ncbi:MAG: hypothetical protein LC118_12185 [Dehalococcoidia bacterium]|nr:hypothetical protein [Dehalococcoidia bacterium]
MAYEKQEPRTKLIFGIAGASVVTVTFALLGVYSYYQQMTDREQQVKVLGVDNPVLIELRAEEHKTQTTYAKIVEAGKPDHYRIPIDVAMDVLAKRGRDAVPAIQPDPKNEWVNGAPPAASSAAPPEPKPEGAKDEKKDPKKDPKRD